MRCNPIGSKALKQKSGRRTKRRSKTQTISTKKAGRPYRNTCAAICATVCTVACAIVCAYIAPIEKWRAVIGLLKGIELQWPVYVEEGSGSFSAWYSALWQLEKRKKAVHLRFKRTANVLSCWRGSLWNSLAFLRVLLNPWSRENQMSSPFSREKKALPSKTLHHESPRRSFVARPSEHFPPLCQVLMAYKTPKIFILIWSSQISAAAGTNRDWGL